MIAENPPPTSRADLEEVYPTFESWKERGQYFTASHLTPFSFETGEWLLGGQALFDGEDVYDTAEVLTGLSRKTLKSVARVASQVSSSLRDENRVRLLTWHHFEAVAHLPVDQQKHWLQRAEYGDLSVPSLRKYIKKETKPTTKPEKTREETVSVNVELPRATLDAVTVLAKARQWTAAEYVLALVVTNLMEPATIKELSLAAARRSPKEQVNPSDDAVEAWERRFKDLDCPPPCPRPWISTGEKVLLHIQHYAFLMTRQPDLEFSISDIQKDIGGGFTEKHERFILAEARKIAQASRSQASMKPPRTIADVECEAEEYEAHLDEDAAQRNQVEDAQEQCFPETDEPF